MVSLKDLQMYLCYCYFRRDREDIPDPEEGDLRLQLNVADEAPVFPRESTVTFDPETGKDIELALLLV